MKKIIALTIILSAGAFFYFSKNADSSVTIEPTEVAIEPQIKITKESYTIQDGDTFISSIEELGFEYAQGLEIVEAASEIFDFTSVKLGKDIAIVSHDGVQAYLEYEPGTEYVIRVDLLNAFETVKAPIEYDIEIAHASVTIESSLFVSGINAGLDEELILQFADIFAWEIDFATQIQTGDSIEVTYEKRFRDGKESGVGDVLKGSMTNNGETYYAYQYVNPEERVSYYNEKGESLVREFLKAPLSYSRITSGFTYSRFHPTLKTTTPHLAIDYAAPTGTPIMSVADGVVTQASWNGGFGNFIDIRHNSTYETQYAHLSAYNVRAGDSVKQGDIIGYVGSTGFSTGPHLHYQVEVNGQLQNPLEIDFPAGDPIPEEEMEEFYKQKEYIDSL
jgi:murein DD-endopeptidase MepM/ murein hydrolase activator NlpD